MAGVPEGARHRTVRHPAVHAHYDYTRFDGRQMYARTHTHTQAHAHVDIVSAPHTHTSIIESVCSHTHIDIYIYLRAALVDIDLVKVEEASHAEERH